MGVRDSVGKEGAGWRWVMGVGGSYGCYKTVKIQGGNFTTNHRKV